MHLFLSTSHSHPSIELPLDKRGLNPLLYRKLSLFTMLEFLEAYRESRAPYPSQTYLRIFHQQSAADCISEITDPRIAELAAQL